jgi:DNA repair exonuclease SbcCD ATPase subunit
VATKKERIKTMSDIQLEPTAPAIELWRGRPAPAKADLIGADPAQQRQEEQNKQRIEQERELEQKLKSSAVKRLPEQPRVDLVSELDSALTALEAGAVDFENSFGKINEPLVQARAEVERLRAELAEAEARLSAIETRGDSVTRLSNAVSLAEAQLQGLLATAETEAIAALAKARYGWEVPRGKLSPEVKRELSLHGPLCL